jgi:hypothetical protein
MQTRVVATARGARWLAEGWRLFRAAPFGWFAVAVAYLALTQGIALVPLVGAAAAAVLVPALTVGVMAAARAADAGGRVEIGMLFDGLKHDRRRQLLLGLVYLAGALLALAGFMFADGDGALRSLMEGQRASEALQADALLWPFAVVALIYAPVMMMFWFAPPLAAWHGMGAAQALFISFFACLINWRAFLAYGAATAVVALALPFLLLSTLTLIGVGDLQAGAKALLFPLLVVLLPTLFASYYASYRDVFGTPEQ